MEKYGLDKMSEEQIIEKYGLDKMSEEQIIEKYGLETESEMDFDEFLLKHPDFEEIRKEVDKISMCQSHGISRTANSFETAPQLFKILFSDEELDSIGQVFKSDNSPLIFVREEGDKITSLQFVKFSNNKKFFENMHLNLTFDLFSEDIKSVSQKDNFIKVLNDSLDEIANLEMLADSDNMITYGGTAIEEEEPKLCILS
ncbi:MAG: hypothetical protein Barrevirus14_5 [Barrevirus sp.]|uniref:Uncharacterized protein n=1 Tax=Barrevirus sp. TaxID=2487763 RepID=A0A3G4ZQG1_9VIRU|nr:MAG: hypothetical protein Barrevirus14_5 [Barrevirus sp.]